MEPDRSMCLRNAPGFVCLVDWSVWFFWMNFQSDQPNKPDRRDRPNEPAFVGRAHAGNPPCHPLGEREERRSLRLGNIPDPFASDGASDQVKRAVSENARSLGIKTPDWE